MDRSSLADFLRRRRESLQPEDVGLPAGVRRRTPGLRREEVAQLAHMSADFYARLEQGRGARPSAETARAISSALRLTPFERDHLYTLAGHSPSPLAFRTDQPSPGLLRVLDAIDAPAQILSDIGVTLKQNQLAQALVGIHTNYSGLRRSIVYRWFTDERERVRHPAEEYHIHAAGYVGMLREAQARNPSDPETAELVEALLVESREFSELWTAHLVTSRAGTIKRFIHPKVGSLTLDCQIFAAKNELERLVVFTAAPGSEDAAKLKLLAVVGNQEFHSAASA